jgi:hypothetical protein
MVERLKLVQELKRTCPPGNPDDHSALVEALQRGDSEGSILFMPEVFRWPTTYRWLRDRL